MDDYRSAYATAGQVTDLWMVIEGLRNEIASLNERLARISDSTAGGEAGAGATASAAAGAISTGS